MHSSQRAVWRNGGGSADLKGSAEIPPLRQAASPLSASGENVVGRIAYRKESRNLENKNIVVFLRRKFNINK
jgi:hypothetical protein